MSDNRGTPNRWCRIGGLVIPDTAIRSREDLVLVLAGAGVAPGTFSAAVVKARLENSFVVFIDYLAGSGPFDMTGMAGRLSELLADRCGRTFLIGHSLGGALALMIAARVGNGISGIVVSDTGLSTTDHGDPRLPERLRSDWSEGHRETFLRSWTQNGLNTELRTSLIEHLEAVDPAAMAESVESLRALSLLDVARSVVAPTAVLHGIFDERRKLHEARAISEFVSGAQLFLFDCGHTPFIERPSEVGTVMRGLGWFASDIW